MYRSLQERPERRGPRRGTGRRERGGHPGAVLAYLRTVAAGGRSEPGPHARGALTGAGALLRWRSWLPTRDGPDRAQARGRASGPRRRGFPRGLARRSFVGCSATRRLRGLRASLIVAVTSTALAVAAAVPAATTPRAPLPRAHGLPAAGARDADVLAPALVVGLYREFFDWGLVNTYAALISRMPRSTWPSRWMLRGFSHRFRARSRRRPRWTAAGGSACSCAWCCRSRARRSRRR